MISISPLHRLLALSHADEAKKRLQCSSAMMTAIAIHACMSSRWDEMTQNCIIMLMVASVSMYLQARLLPLRMSIDHMPLAMVAITPTFRNIPAAKHIHTSLDHLQPCSTRSEHSDTHPHAGPGGNMSYGPSRGAAAIQKQSARLL